jgi:hypothetical protein
MSSTSPGPVMALDPARRSPPGVRRGAIPRSVGGGGHGPAPHTYAVGGLRPTIVPAIRSSANMVIFIRG